MKYPRTMYYPTSPAIASDGRYIKDTSVFINKPIIITEKIDGSNTLLWKNEVYGRSTFLPSHEGWRAMVRKHHQHRPLVANIDTDCWLIYGEDIFGVHSIAYDAVKEDETFYIFGMRHVSKHCGKKKRPYYSDLFAHWTFVENAAVQMKINTVPVLFEGEFTHIDDLNQFLYDEHQKPSILGGEREGMVIRVKTSFDFDDFNRYVAKSVRANHVQTEDHWTRRWKPCKIERGT